MKLDTNKMPKALSAPKQRVGDVYWSRKGAPMVIVCFKDDDRVCLLMFNNKGSVIGVEQYGLRYLREKPCLGRVTNFPEQLKVVWGS